MVRVDVVWFGEQPKYHKSFITFLKKMKYLFLLELQIMFILLLVLLTFKQYETKNLMYEFNLETTNKSYFLIKFLMVPQQKQFQNL